MQVYSRIQSLHQLQKQKSQKGVRINIRAEKEIFIECTPVLSVQ